MRFYKFDFDVAKENKLFHKYTQLQVDSIENIICECNNQGLSKNQTAYVLATAYHEAFDYDGKTTGTIQRIVPIKEKGSEAYLKSKKYYPHIGYGFVQITWLDNYKKFQPLILEKFGVDIIKNPSSMLQVNIASFIIVYGMKNAMFTKFKLSDYIHETKTDYLGARRIVNGVDKARTIADYAKRFQDCIY